MNNKPGYLFLQMAVFFFAMGCERIIDYPIPADDLKVVINSIINTDSIIMVNVSKSIGILNPGKSPHIQNATINLYENNTHAGLMSYKGNGFYSLDGFIPKSSAEYRVVLKNQDESEVEATCIIPEPVPVISVDTVLRLQDQDSYYKSYTYDIILTVQDPPGISNYYELNLFQKVIYGYMDTAYNVIPRAFYTDDPVLEYYRMGNNLFSLSLNLETDMYNANAAYFSDKLLDGTKFTLKFSLEHWNMTGMYYICLRSLTKDYYSYIASLAAYSQADGNPFSERVQVHTNIVNGLGIFGGYSTSKDSVFIKMDYF
ncbi:MAG: DUF4249 domain-containing protein [Bacteroidales bacterium]